ncbi:hypothetical protein FLONG3_11168 [Fusarium longipes]|uniref:F-box domain-containing protein n=1 Tax=Fusarium longipes TaxID=694270 RepID=A0A395RHH1_9HYPO|nr:hypothetical protein FLONG3_11168 [Fusarium longipes]
MKTLLVSASRVCRYWAATIAESPKIQQALFFQPLCQTGMQRPESFTLNPLLVEKFGRCFFDIDRKDTHLRRADSFLRLPWAPKGATTKQGPVGSLALEKTNRLETLTRSSSSWRRMLVSQPPPPSLGYLKLDVVDIWFHEVHTAQIDPSSPLKGLTMGQLYDTVHGTICDRKSYSTWYRVSWDKTREGHQMEVCREQVSRLLMKTNVVVEFYGQEEGDDEYGSGPWDISSVREAFRCEGCGDGKIANLIEAELQEFQPLHLDVSTPIWYHTVEDSSIVDVESCGYGYDRWPR